VVENGNYELCSGFWCGVQTFFVNVFLPYMNKK